MSEQIYHDFREMRASFNERLSKILFGMFHQKQVPYSALRKVFRTKYGVELNSGSISSYQNTYRNNIPPVVLMEACALLGISVDELFRLASLHQGTDPACPPSSAFPSGMDAVRSQDD